MIVNFVFLIFNKKSATTSFNFKRCGVITRTHIPPPRKYCYSKNLTTFAIDYGILLTNNDISALLWWEASPCMHSFGMIVCVSSCGNMATWTDKNTYVKKSLQKELAFHSQFLYSNLFRVIPMVTRNHPYIAVCTKP